MHNKTLWTFWNKAKADLAKVAPDYKLTKIEEKSTAKRNVYLVEMKSIDNGDGKPVTIRGYYAEPVAPGTYPVIITQNGYDSNANIPALNFCPNGKTLGSFSILNINVVSNSFWLKSFAFLSSASIYILLNLYILNFLPF